MSFSDFVDSNPYSFSDRGEAKKKRLEQKNAELGLNAPLSPQALQQLQPVTISQQDQNYTDGDNLTPKFRIGSDRENVSTGTWETAKPDWWFEGRNSPDGAINKQQAEQRIKQMNVQAIQLDRYRGVPVGTSTWADVNLMGEQAAKIKNTILNRNDGIVDPNNPDAPIVNQDKAFVRDLGLKDKSGGNRNIVEAFNTQGENVGLALNTPETNPAYYSKFNKAERQRVQDIKEAQANERRKKNLYSDYDIKNSTIKATINRGLMFAQGVNQVGGITTASGIAQLNDNTDNISDKAKVVFSNIGKKRDKLIIEKYGSLNAFNKLQNKDKALKGVNEELYLKKLNTEERNLVSGGGQFQTKQDKANVESKKKGTFSSNEGGLAKERLIQPLADALKPTFQKNAKDQKDYDKSNALMKAASNIKDVIDKNVSIIGAPIKLANSITRSVVDMIGNIGKEDSKAEGFKPSQIGHVYAKLKSQEELDKTALAVGKGLDIGLKELINNSNTERLQKNLEKSSNNFKFNLLKYEKSNKTAKDTLELASNVGSIILSDLGKAVTDVPAMLDSISGSLPEMIAITMSGGGFAGALYANSLNQGKINYKKNHQNRDASGKDLAKLHGAVAISTALRVGAAEIAIGKLGSVVGKQTGISKELAGLFKNKGIPLLNDKKLGVVKKNKEGQNTISANTPGFSAQGKILEAKNKELSTLVQGAENSLAKHTNDLALIEKNLTNPKLSNRAKINLEKRRAKVQELKDTNTIGLTDLKNKLNSNTKAIAEHKGIDKRLPGLQKKQNYYNQQKAQIDLEIKTLKSKGIDAGTTPTNLARIKENKVKLQALESKRKSIDQKLIELDDITDTNLGKNIVSARTESRIPIFKTENLKMSLSDKGFRELSSIAKIMDTSPGKLVNATAKASIALAASGATEYVEEFGEEVFTQLRDNVGTDKTLDLDKARVAGAIGFGAGVGLGAIPTTVDNGKDIIVEGTKTLGKGTVKGTSIAAKVINTVAIKPTSKVIQKVFPNLSNKVGDTLDKSLEDFKATAEFSKNVYGKAIEAKDKIKESGVIGDAKNTVKNAGKSIDEFFFKPKEKPTNTTVNNTNTNTNKPVTNVLKPKGTSSTINTDNKVEANSQNTIVKPKNKVSEVLVNNIETNTNNNINNTVTKEESIKDLKQLKKLNDKGKLTEDTLTSNKTIVENTDAKTLSKIKQAIKDDTITEVLDESIGALDTNPTNTDTNSEYKDYTTNKLKSRGEPISSTVTVEEVKSQLQTDTNTTNTTNRASEAVTTTLATNIQANSNDSKNVEYNDSKGNKQSYNVTVEESIKDIEGLIQLEKDNKLTVKDVVNNKTVLANIKPENLKHIVKEYNDGNISKVLENTVVKLKEKPVTETTVPPVEVKTQPKPQPKPQEQQPQQVEQVETKPNSVVYPVHELPSNTEPSLAGLQTTDGKGVITFDNYKEVDNNAKIALLEKSTAPINTNDEAQNLTNAATNYRVLIDPDNLTATVGTKDTAVVTSHLRQLQQVKTILDNQGVLEGGTDTYEALNNTINALNGVRIKFIQFSENSKESFNDTDINNTVGTVFTLDPTDQKNKDTVVKAIDTVLKQNPDNKVAQTGKTLVEAIDNGFVNHKETPRFKEVINTLTGFSGVATDANNDTQYTAVKGVQDIIDIGDTETLSIVGNTLQSISKDYEGKLNKVEEFIAEGNTNKTLEMDGKSYTLGTEVNQLKESMEAESTFVDNINSYFTAVAESNNVDLKLLDNINTTDTTATTTDTTIEDTGIRTEGTKEFPLTVKSNEPTDVLQEDLTRLTSLNKKNDTVLQDIEDIKQELTARNVEYTTESPLKLNPKLKQAGLGNANKLISIGKPEGLASKIANSNPENSNSNKFSKEDVVGLNLDPEPTKNDVAVTTNKLRKVVDVGARVVGVDNIESKEAREEITTLLKKSGYIQNPKTKVYSYSDSKFKGTLSDNVDGSRSSTDPDVVAAEVRSLKNSNPETVQDTLDWAVSHAPDNTTKSLLNALNRTINSKGLDVQLEFGSSRVNNKGIEYTPRGNVSFQNNKEDGTTSLKLFLNNKTGGYKTVVHELVHVATVQQMYSPQGKPQLEKIGNLLNSVKTDEKIASLGYVHGLKNEAEFIAELSNPKFRALLDTIKIEQPKNTDTSKGILLTALDAVKKVFKDALGSILGKEDYTALDAGIEALDELLSGDLSLEANNLLNNNTVVKSKNKRILNKFRENLKDPDIDTTIYDENSNINYHRTNKFKLNNHSLQQLAVNTFENKFLYNNKTKFAHGELNPLRNNIDVNSNRIGSVFSLLPRGIRSQSEIQSLLDLDTESKGDQKELRYVAELSSYVRDFEKSLNEVLPDLSKVRKEKLGKTLKESPILGFYANSTSDSMDVTIKDAMAMASRVWLSEDAIQNSFNNNDAMHKILGNSNNSIILPTEASNVLSEIGLEQGQAVERLGNLFIAMMPLKALKGADGALIQKIKNSAALYMISAMAKRDEIKLYEKANWELDHWRQTSSKDKNARVHFIKPNIKVHPDGKTETKTNILKNKERDHKYRHLRAAITGTTSNLQMPNDKPITVEEVKATDGNALVKMSRTMRKAILANGQIPYVLSQSQYDLVQRLGLDNIKEMLRGDQSELNHSYFANSLTGKNLNVDENINNLELWINQRGKDNLDKPIYMLHRLWSNVRMGITNNAINFQASKFHRYMFGAKDWYYNFNLNNTNNSLIPYVDSNGTRREVNKLTLAKKNILQGLGFKNLSLDNTDTMFDSVLANIKDHKNSNLSKAVRYINNGKELSTSQSQTILDAIAEAGNKTRSLNALNNLAMYVKAVEGNGIIKNMLLPHEIDGITNGTAISLMQMPFNVEKAKNILRATGIFFEGDTWSSAEEFKADPSNKDNYETLADIAASLLNMNKIASYDNNGNEILSLDISEYAALNNIIMPKMFEEDGVTISSEGRNFTKEFLMTYIYSKGNKARMEDVSNITVSNIYSKLAKIDKLFDEGISESNILSNKHSNKYNEAKRQLKELNQAINGMRKQTIKNRRDLVSAVNKLIVKARSAKGRRNIKNKRKIERDIRRLMLQNSYLLPRGSYDFNATDSINTNFNRLIEFAKEEESKPINDIFDTGNIETHKPLYDQLLPADVEAQISQVASKVYGSAINEGLSLQLGDFQHSRSLMNIGINYASNVSYMIYQARVDREKKKEAVRLGLNPNTDVNLSRAQIKKILINMAKDGELHTIKHASSSKDIRNHVDSLLILSENLVKQKNSEGKVTIPLQGKITRKTPKASKGIKKYNTYSTLSSNISNFEFDPDTRVKGSVNLTHAFDGNVQAAMMATGESMSNNHDAKIVGALDSIQSEIDYNEFFFNLNKEYSMYTEVERTVLRSYRTFLEFQKYAGKNSKYIKDFNNRVFPNDIRKALKVPLLHDKKTDSYISRETKDLNGKTIQLGSKFKNGLEVVSAVSTEAAHIRENAKKLYKDVRFVNQYSSLGQSYAVPNNEVIKPIDTKDIEGLKTLIKHNANQEDSIIHSSIEDFFEFDDLDVNDVKDLIEALPYNITKTTLPNPFTKIGAFHTNPELILGLNDNKLSADRLKITVNSLTKLDESNNISISPTHSRMLDNFFDTTGIDLLSLSNKIKLSVANNKGSSTSMGIDKGEIYISTGDSIVNSNNPIGAKESLAHALSSMTWNALRKKDKRVNRELFKVMNTVLSGKNPITYRDFLKYPEKNSTEADIESAKKFFNDIFLAKNIEAFAAFASTNEMMIKAISRFEIPDVIKDEKTGTLTNFLQRTFANGMNLLFSKNLTADKHLLELANNIKTINDKSYISTFGLDGLANKANTAFGNTVVKNLYRPYSKFITELNKNHRSRFSITKEDKERGKLTKLPVTLFKITGGLAFDGLTLLGKIEDVPKLGKVIQDMTASHNNWFSTLAHDLVTELRSAKSIEREYYKLLRHTKYYSEAEAAKAKSGFIKQYKAMFDPNKLPTNRDQEAFTNVLLRTDIQSIIDIVEDTGDMSIKSLLTSKASRKKLENDLLRLLAPIAGNRFEYYKFYSKNLGRYLTTKKFSTNGLMKNANHIANMKNITDPNIRYLADKLTNDELELAEDIINKLATLESLNHVSKEEARIASDFIENENNKKEGDSAIGFLIHHHRALQIHQQELQQKDNEGYQVDKGYLHDVRTNDTDVVVKLLDKNTHKELTKNGFILNNTHRVGNSKIGVYYSKSTNSQKYQTGIMNINSGKNPTSLSFNRVVKDKARNNLFRKISNNAANKEAAMLLKGRIPNITTDTFAAPNLNEVQVGYTPYYTFELSNVVTGSINSIQNNAGTVIGNTLGHNVTTNTAPKFNNELISLIEKDYKNNYKDEPDEFITVSAKDGSVKQRESIGRMPIRLVKALEDTFGKNKPIVVRRSTFYSAFGFVKVSAVNGSILNSLKDTNTFKKLVLHTERIWQAVVARAKTNVIINNPKTLASNTFSNAVVLATLGVPPNLILKYQQEALVSAIRYRKITKEIANIKRKLIVAKSSGESYKGMQSDKLKVKQLELELKSSSIHDMVSDGLLQSVVEDVAVTDSTVLDSLDSAIGAFTKSGKGYVNELRDKVAVSSAKLPISPIDVLKNTIITPDTDLASALRDATQYSDFVARYALIKHRTSKGVSRKEAIEEALDTFIDYDMHTNPLIQYSNDMGIIQYTKFLFRIQKVILRQVKNNPLNTVALLLMQLGMTDVPDITDSNLAHGAYSPGISNILDDAFQLNMLKFLPGM